MDHVEHARRLIEDVLALGAREFCVCAGSRNAALLAMLGASSLRLYSFVDERSAAFFALGRIKLHGHPVAVVTTSGTAVAELLPAAVEGHYSGLPLVLISADRPARFRGTGAPQSIEQVGIFGLYAETSIANWTRDRSLHLNIELEDVWTAAALPLSHPPEPAPRISRAAKAASVPPDSKLIIVGALHERHRERARTFLRNANAPTFAEPLSGLREDATLPLITSGERMIRRARFDRVIRIGGVPTLRYWRDLEDLDLPVTHFSDLPFPGLTRGEVHPIEALPDVRGDRDEAFFAEDAERAIAFGKILGEEPRSELAMFRKLSEEIGENARVYIGNSLPIREWDLAATRENRGFTIEANRGANGIDGQLSTFFGQCDPARENVCIVGDLTAIYDLNAPWIVPQLDAGTRFRIVIMNNGGGRIFSRVASLRAMDVAMRERIVENVHDVRFEHWAAMWGIDVTELLPDEAASRRAWARYDALWA
jgi:2-succinyl-5-enolpyruvyl-6-hydroxy-3-cyclohexene-1-carboxylate synthase